MSADLLIVNIRLFVHRLDIIHAERQYVFVVDCIDNGICMQLVPERLLGGAKFYALCSALCIDGKNRRSRKPEQMIFFETPRLVR